LKENRWGAGNTLKEFEDRLNKTKKRTDFAKLDLTAPILTLKTKVRKEWGDYNGHMTESRYLECFSDATTEMMAIVGVDEEYISSIGSYFTVETHIRHLDEVLIGEGVYATTQSSTVPVKNFTYSITCTMRTTDC